MTRRQQRLCAIGLILLGAVVAAGLALFALRDTVTFFYTPSDLKGAHAKFIAPERPFRLGGLVEKGSLKHEGSIIHFTVTDTVENIEVIYDGIPPDLFRENSGVVANGKLNADGTFVATQLLAKHDENYMPPEVAKALKGKGMTLHEKQFFVYILASERNGTLYVGITSDLVKRVWQHKEDHADGFTKENNIKELVYYERHDSAEAAITREKQIKKWKRQWKINLIVSFNPLWRDLYTEICG